MGNNNLLGLKKGKNPCEVGKKVLTLA